MQNVVALTLKLVTEARDFTLYVSVLAVSCRQQSAPSFATTTCAWKQKSGETCYVSLFFFQRKGKGIYCFMELRRALSFFLCSWKAGHILPQNARFTAPHGELHGHRSGVSCLRLASNNYVTPLMRICNAILSSYCFYLQHHFFLGLTLFIYFRLTVWMASLYCSPQRPHI